MIEEVVKILHEKDKIAILCHCFPDGDTIGSAYALYDALKSINKTVKIECADNFGSQFTYITDGIEFEDFTPEYVIAVDVPTSALLGKIKDKYPEIDLSIDHHKTHIPFAKITYVQSEAAATCEIIYDICVALCGDINKTQATALYTGIATDTGCFKFSNTTAHTHLIAAKLIAKNVDCEKIHQFVFSKSKACAILEAVVLLKTNFYFDDKIAIQSIDRQTQTNLGVSDEDIGNIAGVLQNIDCVMIGITVREIDSNTFKISVRTKNPISASQFCQKFGGGGHENAAGATINGSISNIYNRLITEAKKSIFTI